MIRSAFRCPGSFATPKARDGNWPACKEPYATSDAQVGRLLASLKQLGLEENTLAIFTTDHGIAMPRAKGGVYEPGVQVAFMLRLPSRKGWHGGLVKNEMISNIDYLPTILDLVGLPIPANVQGRSFAPLLDGKSYEPGRRFFQSSPTTTTTILAARSARKRTN